MSEVRLNLVDSEQVLHGTIHGSVADRCVAALSAEPETIAELTAALARYNKQIDDCRPFATFRCSAHSSDSPQSIDLDTEPWDAGIVVIDLAARIVASESTYSQPGPEGEVDYHDGTKSTDVAVLYRLPDDWLFVNSVEAYQWSRERRAKQRLAHPPLDAREVLYGAPLLDFIIDECAKIEISNPDANGDGSIPGASSKFPDSKKLVSSTAATIETASALISTVSTSNANELEPISDAVDPLEHALSRELSAIHARWLMTPREDLRGQSPREVLLAKQDFIDFDLHTRSLQWSLQNEGPPCLSPDSFAYRFAGFGTHEWVIYYDLVRHLLWSVTDLDHSLSNASTPGSAPTCRSFGRREMSTQTSALSSHEPGLSPPAHETLNSPGPDTTTPRPREALFAQLEQLKSTWLEQPHPDYDGRIPAILIDNERKRLPIALRPRDMIIDEDCPMCQMFGDETTPLGMGVGFWHLDGCNMDDDFAFSPYPTREEWEAENRSREEFNKEFDRRWRERQQRIARGEELEPDPFFNPDPFPGLELDDSSARCDESIDNDEKERPQ